jgi:hypothetical protein
MDVVTRNTSQANFAPVLKSVVMIMLYIITVVKCAVTRFRVGSSGSASDSYLGGSRFKPRLCIKYLVTSNLRLPLISSASYLEKRITRKKFWNPIHFTLCHLFGENGFETCEVREIIFYICIVHTVVLFQRLVGVHVYCQTQHVKYCWKHITSVICFGSYYNHLQAWSMQWSVFVRTFA